MAFELIIKRWACESMRTAKLGAYPTIESSVAALAIHSKSALSTCHSL
jgi:hypothetical protein